MFRQGNGPARLRFYKKRGGDLFVLIFSFLLAFFMWSMYRLSLEYSAVFEYKIKLSTNLTGRSKSAVSQNSLIIRGTTSGISIVQQRIENKELALFIDAQYLKKRGGEGDLFGLCSNDLKDALQHTLGSEFKVESVASDTLVFNFPRQSYRRVPVRLLSKVGCRPQYAIFSEISTTPDSIYIYGENDRIAAIDHVQTKSIRKSMADSPIQGVVKLKGIEGIEFSEEEVYYSIDVQRYYENSCQVNVSVINSPPGSLVTIFPQKVTVTYWALYRKRRVSSEDFTIVADYSQLFNAASSVEKNIKLELLSAPDHLFNIRITPQFAGCMVN